MSVSVGARREQLRALVAAPEILLCPGAQDTVTAMLAESVGFKAFFTGDYNATAVLLGEPDYGLITMTEMSQLVGRLVDVTSIPLIADAGCGYGNPLNVFRTIQWYEKAGAAGVTLEDQPFPKRCGHMEGKEIISTAEMVAKLHAATDAREDPNLMIIARSDAIRSEDIAGGGVDSGMDEAIRRGQAYAEAGADAFWVDAVPTLDYIERLCREVPVPIQVAMIEGGKTPHVTARELEQAGVAIELDGLASLFAATAGVRHVFEALLRDGTTAGVLDRMVTFTEFNEFIGLRAKREMEDKYGLR